VKPLRKTNPQPTTKWWVLKFLSLNAPKNLFQIDRNIKLAWISLLIKLKLRYPHHPKDTNKSPVHNTPPHRHYPHHHHYTQKLSKKM
jgi:hypothetical protein